MSAEFPDEIVLADAGMRGGNRLFRLVHSFRAFTSAGLIRIPVGFVTDGASIPRLFWNILQPFGPYFPAALLHDFLYSKQSDVEWHGIDRAHADKLFLEAMEGIGIGWIQRKTIYRAVRIFGRGSYKVGRIDKAQKQGKIKHMTAFQAWFDKQGFRNFTAGEFESYFNTKRHGGTNATPDEALWSNIVPTLRVLDDLRDELGVPITITSSYRSEAYNRKCGGVDNSQHRQFRALDFQVSRHTPKQAAAVLKKWRDAGKFTGGIGTYPTFVHLDTRRTNATW